MSTSINIKNVDLHYEFHHDLTNSLKEHVVNFFHRKKYVTSKKSICKALHQVNLHVAEGERVGVLGHNGAGKSTLLKVISGILKPTNGQFSVNGSIQPLIEIAAGFNYELSGRENIYLNGYMLGFTREQIQQRESEIISFSELEEFIEVPVKYYSSGMSVRLAFAIATTIEPEILIFDELLSAGDNKFQEKAKARLENIMNQAKIIVIASHSMETIRNLCPRSILLEKGSVIFDGPTNDAIDLYINGSIKKPEL